MGEARVRVMKKVSSCSVLQKKANLFLGVIVFLCSVITSASFAEDIKPEHFQQLAKKA
jgi:hypothetical protein